LKEFSKFGFLVAALGFGVGYFVGGFLDPAAGNRTFSVMAITWAILVGLFSLSILWLFREWIVGRCSPPIQFRQYRASEGTVALRFRRNEYAELLLSSLRDKGTLKVSE
jgi:hypothetical protein